MEILSNRPCVIGEGPIWNEKNGLIYHVNGYGPNEICIINPKTKELTVRKLPFGVAAIAFSEKGEMIVSCANGAFILNDDNTTKPLYDPNIIIKNGNDAKVGPDGRFYIGTQSSKRMGSGDKIDGKLYSIDKYGNVKILLDGLILSNGFDWSMDEKRLYHTDSDTRIIKEYLFDKESGEVTFSGREIAVEGVDGFTIDQNDRLYASCWGRGHIAVVDTKSMTIERYIETPAKIPTSCGFAGENMDKLVITTATLGADLEKDKNAGCTFITDLNTKGRKPYLFGASDENFKP